jgi:hypothetical protein
VVPAATEGVLCEKRSTSWYINGMPASMTIGIIFYGLILLHPEDSPRRFHLKNTHGCNYNTQKYRLLI